MTYPHPEHFAALLMGPTAGLFLYTPITLIGLAGLAHEIWRSGRNAALGLTACLILLSYLVFYSAYQDFQGGATFGPRFLIAALPFVLLGVAFAYEFLPARLIYAVG